MISFDDLAAHETTDPVLAGVRDRAATLLLASSAAQELEALRLAIVDFERVPAAVREAYFTANCMAVEPEHGIVVNESFLRDAEIAIRAFGLAGSVFTTPFLRNESGMFGLVQRLRECPREYLAALRTLSARPASEQCRREELALALVFFLGHEVDHLRAGGDRRAFTVTLPEDAPLETQLAAATAKYCRHVDELYRYGFDLPGFEKVFTRGGEIRSAADAVLASLPPNQAINQDAWFAAESRADACGGEVLVQALNAGELWAAAPAAGPTLALRALFAVAVVSWFVDFKRLLERLGPHADPEKVNLGSFMVDMMSDRQSYVRASSVFGYEHRFTLLRGALAMSRVLHECTRYDDDPQLQSLSYGGPDPARRAHADGVTRWFLIRRLMDTAVKLATMGASTAWILEKDRERGTPQIFMMQFESLAGELRWLRSAGG